MIDWISTKDRLPEYGQNTLIYIPDEPSSYAIFVSVFEERLISGNERLAYGWRGPGPFRHFGHAVSHWAPITAPGKPEASAGRYGCSCAFACHPDTPKCWHPGIDCGTANE